MTKRMGGGNGNTKGNSSSERKWEITRDETTHGSHPNQMWHNLKELMGCENGSGFSLIRSYCAPGWSAETDGSRNLESHSPLGRVWYSHRARPKTKKGQTKFLWGWELTQGGSEGHQALLLGESVEPHNGHDTSSTGAPWSQRACFLEPSMAVSMQAAISN